MASEGNEKDWEHTKLAKMTAAEIKLLLHNRGEWKPKGKKSELLERLKQKSIKLTDSQMGYLSSKEALVELKLHGLNDKPAKKDILIARLNGDKQKEVN